MVAGLVQSEKILDSELDELEQMIRRLRSKEDD